ncbi:MAG TPA: hypothetical protein VF576_04475 [Rubricoccaceae bacterium]
MRGATFDRNDVGATLLGGAAWVALWPALRGLFGDEGPCAA